MKKILVIAMVSTFLLSGCGSDDTKEAAKGNVKVVAIDGINIKGFPLTEEGFPLIEDGYYNESNLGDNKDMASSFDFKTKDDLENLGINVKSESCALLTKKTDESELCLDIEDGQNICMPKEFESIGYRIFTIDINKLDVAVKNDFQQADSLKLFKRLDYNDVSCDTLK